METYYPEIAQAHPRIARVRVFADLRILARDSEDLLIATAHETSARVKAARSRVTLALERARDTIIGLQQQALVAAHVANEKGNTVIRKHPLEFVGAAFGLGLLIGVLAVRGCPPKEDST